MIFFRKITVGDRVSFESSCKDCTRLSSNISGKARAKRLRKTDKNFRLRRSVSFFIWKTLKTNNASKNKESCLKYLSYTIQELKDHLESLFEPWMNWDNQGNYIKKQWDDNNSSTWKWHLDHIIPQSILQYTSMEDDNFKKCWALDNLRPLSAKQNVLDGINRVRHK